MEIGDGKERCNWLVGKQKEKPTLLLKMTEPNWQIKIDFYKWSKLTDDQSANKLFFISIEDIQMVLCFTRMNFKILKQLKKNEAACHFIPST